MTEIHTDSVFIYRAAVIHSFNTVDIFTFPVSAVVETEHTDISGKHRY